MLNHIALEMETLSDGFAKALSRRHIPFSDTTLIRDLGLRERRVRLRCYFWGETYETHKALVGLLWGRQDFELNHPEYGLIPGQVDRVNVRHDDREQAAEVDLDFIAGTSRVPVAASTDIQGDAGELAAAGYLAAAQDLRDKLVAESPLPAEVVDMALDPELDMIDQVPQGLASKARAYIKRLDKMVHELTAFCDGITAPVDSLVADVELALSIPGRMIGTVAATVEKLTVRFITLKNAPGRFVDSIVNQLRRFKYPLDSSLFGGSSSDRGGAISLPDKVTAGAVLATAAIGLSATVAQVYAGDETLRADLVRAESGTGFDDLGRMTGNEPAGMAMNIREIEDSLFTVREICALAVENNRDVAAVKQLADALLDHVVRVKLDAEKIIRIEVDNEMPLHKVCLAHGLPYRAAERIMLINQIRHPSFVRGGIDIYADR